MTQGASRGEFLRSTGIIALMVATILLLWVRCAPNDHGGHGAERSHSWTKVRGAHLMEEPGCAVCGKTDDVDVHHIKPFHLWPELELEPSNLITLCRDHHLLFGHLGDFKSYNLHVRKDAEEWRKKLEHRPYKKGD